MKNGKGTQNQSTNELAELRHRIGELEKSNQVHNLEESINIEKNKEENILEHPLFKNRMVEDIIKNNIEIIILHILYNKNLCGSEIIKEIFLKYNVLLSQGTVYPYLYSLREKGILEIEYLKGDMRTKKYFPSANGKQIIEKKLNDFIKAEEYVLNSIKKR